MLKPKTLASALFGKKQRCAKIAWGLFLSLLGLGLYWGQGWISSANATPPLPYVVILNSYHQGEAWSDNMLAGILPVLQEKYPELMPTIEHIDAKRHPGHEQRRRFTRLLNEKYSGHKVNLVMALDNPALLLLLEQRDSLFPNVPIVFAGINGFSPEMLKGHSGITGVAENQDIAGTLRLALSLQPKIKKILAIQDYTSSGIAVHRDMEKVLPQFKGKLEVSFNSDAPFGDLEKQLRSLPDDSAVVLLTYVTDKAGRTFSRAESTSLISTASTVPVYAMHETRLGHGILGGMLLEGQQHGEHAARIALRVLGGENASQIPVADSISKPIFDYQQLRRFGLPVSALPPGSELINQPVPMWKLLSEIALPISIVALLLLVWAVVLTLSLFRLKKANLSIKQGEQRYLSLIQTSLDGFWVVDKDGRLLEVNEAYCQMSGYDAETLLTMRISDIEKIESPQDVTEHIKKVTEKGWDRFETRHVRADGKKIDVEISTVYLTDQTKFLTFIHDITERKQAESALRESERLLRNIIDSSADYIYVKDNKLRTIICNKTFAAALGKTPSELIGKTDLENGWDPEFVKGNPAKGIRGFEQDDLKALHGQTVHIDSEPGNVEGAIRYFNTIKLPLIDDDKGVIGILGVSRDVTRQIQAEEQLRQSESLLRAAQNLAKVGGWQWDLEKKSMYWTEEVFRIHGMEPDVPPEGSAELIEKSLTCYDSDDRKTILSAFTRCATEGEPYDLVFPFTAISGQRKWIRTTAQAVYEGKRIVKVVGNIMDISDRKHTEDTLRVLAESGVASEESIFRLLVRQIAVSQGVRYAMLAKVSKDNPELSQTIALWAGDDYGENFTYQLSGTPCAEVTTRGSCFFPNNIQELFPEDHLFKEMQAESYWGTPLLNTNGDVIGIFAIIDDKPMIKRAETFSLLSSFAARASSEMERINTEEKYKRIFQEMSDGFALFEIISDEKGRPIDCWLLAANQTFEKLFGLGGMDVAGKTLSEILPDIAKQLIHLQGPVLSSGESLEINFFDKKLNRHFELQAFRTDPGQFACIFKDVTDSRALEAQLRQAQKMESVGTLAGGIAHDFNNILAAIVGYTEFALEENINGSVAANELKQVLVATERAKDLVKRILTFSRKVEPQLKPLRLNKVVEQSASMLRRTIPRMIEIQLNLSEEVNWIQGDLVQLEQVLMNLGTNARDAMPDGGRLILHTAEVELDQEFCDYHPGAHPGRHVLLTVSDTGCGMEEEALRQIFDPFFTTKEVGSGTGLGLAVTYGIVKSHNGFIYCQSKPGQGTTFEIFFPVLEMPVCENLADINSIEDISGGNETILIVDDESVLRDIDARALAKKGYKVISADSGEQAVSLFRQRAEEIDLVLMDISMPGMGGLRCMDHLLEINPSCKIIISTGYTKEETAMNILETGAAGYLSKPFGQNDLLQKVRQVLDV